MPPPWPTRAIGPRLRVLELVSMAGQLFGQWYGPGSEAFPDSTPAPVVPISPRSSRVVARSEVSPVGRLVADDSAVWLAPASDPSGQAAGEVYVLDPSTLKVRQEIPRGQVRTAVGAEAERLTREYLDVDMERLCGIDEDGHAVNRAGPSSDLGQPTPGATVPTQQAL